jgi:hypothetical protein
MATKQPKTVFLFDIDGVLVEPSGYRAAVQATLRYFTRRMGLPDEIVPDEDSMSLFESQRITSEWDMVPISLAILLEQLLASTYGIELPLSLDECCHYLSKFRLNMSSVDYRTPILQIGTRLRSGEAPSDRLLNLLQENQAGELFPHLQGHPILSELLANTRQPSRSQTTRIFQHFSLGSEIFNRTYRLPAEFDTPSLLQANDRPLLPQRLHDELAARHQNEGLAIAAYTMRPSLPPRQVNASLLGYAPEAEMALELVGMEQYPLIGFGRIQYLAEKTGKPAESYMKPSPVQALAAIFAALSEDEAASLELAARLHTWGRVNDLSKRIGAPALVVHVFEDSPGGIEAVHRAAQELAQNGVSIRTYTWGVASQPDKLAALQAIQVQVFSSTQEAVESALRSTLG